VSFNIVPGSSKRRLVALPGATRRRLARRRSAVAVAVVRLTQPVGPPIVKKRAISLHI
jgi:hypothetical protein